MIIFLGTISFWNTYSVLLFNIIVSKLKQDENPSKMKQEKLWKKKHLRSPSNLMRIHAILLCWIVALEGNTNSYLNLSRCQMQSVSIAWVWRKTVLTNEGKYKNKSIPINYFTECRAFFIE